MARDIVCRNLRLRSDSIDEEQRSVQAVMATEAPTEVYDWYRDRTVNELLMMDGAEHGDQLPLLHAHSRYSLDDVLGSVREIRRENGTLVGTLYLASGDEKAEKAWNKIRQGHLTDVSIGYRPLEREEIKAGERKTIKGRIFSAEDKPLQVTTRWVLKELSLVPIGADANAKLREDAGLRPAETRTEGTSGPEPRTSIRSQTMDKDNTQVQTGAPEQPDAQNVEARNQPQAPAIDNVEELEAQRRLDEERKRQERLRQMAGRDVPGALLDQAIAEGWTPEQASEKFLTGLRGTRQPAVQVVRDNRDSLREDLVTAIRMQVGHRPDDPKTTERVRRFRDIGLHDLARFALQMERIEIPVNRDELFKRAIGTGTFTNLLGDSAAKTLAAAYESYPSTLLRWAGTREVRDFKEYKDIRLSAFASMPQIGNAGEFDSGNLSETYEKMSVKTYGLKFAVTRQMWINDDLGAFARIPLELGRLAARNVDDVGYTLLISASGVGPTMTEDSHALFYARTYTNYNTGSGSALSDSSLSTGKQKMRLVRGLASEILNLVPRVLLVPATLEQTALKLVQSSEIILAKAGTTDATEYLPTKNIHQGSLEVVVEPRLDAGTNGTTAWYLVASPDDVPSLVIVFLRGNRTPVIERHDPTDVLGIGWRVYHDVGVAAVDWRGIQRNKGA